MLGPGGTGGTQTLASSPREGGRPEADARPGAWAYRPHLDGLRAVAVYLVVAFHAGIGRLSGGFIGVDVFFVLSGYLVTGLLLREVDGPTGKLRFGRFYARRFRRLLPAAAVNLIVTAIVFRSVSEPASFDAAWRGIRAAALYVSNWFFISEAADYFGSDITENPVAHYWSLSVEEQFYFAWPLLFVGLTVLCRRLGGVGRIVRVAAIGAAAAASLVAALVLTSAEDPNRAYYGTDTRAYQLLAGALLALVAGRIARLGRSRVAPLLPLATAVALLGLLVTATNQVGMGPVERGVVAAALAVCLLVGLESNRGGPARWLLSVRVVAYLGSISYGTYLWHWLVVIVLTRTWELSHVGTAIVTATIATGLAALSYEVLEQPIRRSARLEPMRPVVIGVGLVISLLVGLVLAPRILTERSVASATVSGSFGGTPNEVDWQAAEADKYGYERCTPSSETACRLTTGDGPTVLVIGESHAAMWLPMLEQVAEREDWNLHGGLLDYCLWPHGVRYLYAGPNCLADQDHLYGEIVDEVDPDIVILGHRAVDDPQFDVQLGGPDGAHPPERRDEALEAAVRRTVDEVREEGRHIVLLEPIPLTSSEADPLICLSDATFLEECRFVATRNVLPEERVFRALAEDDPSVHSLDLDRAACPYMPICDPVVQGTVVRWDASHLTMTYARSLSDEFLLALMAEGVVPAG